MQAQSQNSLIDKIASIDQFGQQFRMKLDKGVPALYSVSGLVFTVVLTVITVSYFFQKLQILLE